jgi:hypothetical protein
MRIRDPGSGMETVRIRDPGWKKVGSGIRDKHPGSATLLLFVCGRKSILEVEFLEEEGTGLGPTLEFFALVAAEFQRSGRQNPDPH